jgi:hypothetical protein
MAQSPSFKYLWLHSLDCEGDETFPASIDQVIDAVNAWVVDKHLVCMMSANADLFGGCLEVSQHRRRLHIAVDNDNTHLDRP